MGKKVLIVGGVAGGASVAARVRRLDESAEIIMFEKGPDVSFSNCCLPYHLSGMIKDYKKIILMNPDVFQKQYNIQARVLSEVVAINSDQKTITIKNVSKNLMYEESYDELFLSPGANALVPPINGIETANTFIVKNVVDIAKLSTYITNNKCKNITVVGGGFIGVETAENLCEGGYNVSLVEAQKQVLKPFDYDMVQVLHKELIDKGINLILNDSVKSFEGNNVSLSSGKVVNGDAVVMAIGVRPDVALAKASGVEIGNLGGIKVDANFMTNIPHIYAVGDAIEVKNAITRKTSLLPLAGPAQKQARAAADHIYGKVVENTGFIGSSCIKVFSYNAAATGLTYNAAIEAGFDADYVYIIPNDKVGLIPGVQPIHYKLVYEVPTGKVLGAQAIGRGEVTKRVDTVATAIKFGATLNDLRDLELCYAPPFSTAKDVVNLSAMVGLNILNDEFKQVKVSEVFDLVKSGAFIIDAREKAEWNHGHLLSAINIPMSEFRQRLNEIPTDKKVYVHCRSGQRSYNVVRALQGLGYNNVYNISGGFMGICFHEYAFNKLDNREKIVSEYNFN